MMKRNRQTWTRALLTGLAAFSLGSGAARAQSCLNEPRVPIKSLPFTISAPGSYYLQESLMGGSGASGITIRASHVTLDLMGFALVGAPGSLHGIDVEGPQSNLTIHNGSISSWGGDGIDAAEAVHSRIEDLRASNNGGLGLSAGMHSIVSRCSAQGNGASGISASHFSTLSECTSAENTQTGFLVGAGSVVVQCTARDNGLDGIWAGDSSSVVECTSVRNAGYGIRAHEAAAVLRCMADSNHVGIRVGTGSSVQDCVASSSEDDGIQHDGSGLVTGCSAAANLGDGIQIASEVSALHNNCLGKPSQTGIATGIHATGSGNRLEANNLTAADRGIDVDFTGNLIIRNSARLNGVNYDIVPGNSVGPIVTSATIGTSSNPHANYSF
jgi:hypothetical protein